jgi:hypothetical protein
MKSKFFALMFLCVIETGQTQSPLFDEREEASVYNAYINKYYIPRRFVESRFENKPFTEIVVSDHTSGFVIPFSYQKKVEELSIKPEEETVKSFLARNDGYYPQTGLTNETLRVVGRYPLNPYIAFKLPHTLISDAEMDRIFERGRWEEFYNKYPNSRGIIYLSRVGFNHDLTQALLYVVLEYADGGGGGWLVLLAKSSDGWEQVANVSVWIS